MEFKMVNDQKPKLAVLLTCFNRRAITLASLAALDDAVAGSCAYDIFLVDDGSTDGTGDAVLAAHPKAQVVRSSGNLYWNKGMRLAWETALPSRPDFFLWLNDDTPLRPRALADMLALYRLYPPKTVIVGCTADPETGAITYGGYKIVDGSISRLRFRHLHVGESECDTMNGNCVMFPASAVLDIGINSEHYSHAFGDVDYGLRATKADYKIIQLAEPVARQERNAKYAESVSRLTLKNWRFILYHPKGVPWREWYAFCKQHGGRMWRINFIYRYVRLFRI